MLRKIKATYPDTGVIIITGYSDIKLAVELIKMGAYDYITKPLYPDEILNTINKAIEAQKAINQHINLSSGTSSKRESKQYIARSIQYDR
jgi:two-component system response regulator HydG